MVYLHSTIIIFLTYTLYTLETQYRVQKSFSFYKIFILSEIFISDKFVFIFYFMLPWGIQSYLVLLYYVKFEVITVVRFFNPLSSLILLVLRWRVTECKNPPVNFYFVNFIYPVNFHYKKFISFYFLFSPIQQDPLPQSQLKNLSVDFVEIRNLQYW